MLSLLKSRQTWLLVIATGIVTFAALFLILAAPQPGVTRENFQRLRVGMDISDVEALLGKPAPDERRQMYIDGRDNYYVRTWTGEGITVALTFSRNRESLEAGFSTDADGHHSLEEHLPVDNLGYKLGVNVWPQAP